MSAPACRRWRSARKPERQKSALSKSQTASIWADFNRRPRKKSGSSQTAAAERATRCSFLGSCRCLRRPTEVYSVEKATVQMQVLASQASCQVRPETFFRLHLESWPTSISRYIGRLGSSFLSFCLELKSQTPALNIAALLRGWVAEAQRRHVRKGHVLPF